MASSSPLSLATLLQLSLSSKRAKIRRFASHCPVFSLSSFNISRRLSLLHFGTVVSQPRLIGFKESTLSKPDRNIDAGTVGNIAQARPSIAEENAVEWAKKDKEDCFMLSIILYGVPWHEVTAEKRHSEEKYSNAFLGYGPEESHFTVELTYNYGVDKYDVGTGFGYFDVAVEDVAKTVDLVKAKRGKVTSEPVPVKDGSSVIAIIEDPDGYKFQLLERAPTSEPLCKVMLRVGILIVPLDSMKSSCRVVSLKVKAYGMELLRKMDNLEYKYTIAIMGYGPEDSNVVLELTCNYEVKEYDKGNGYAQFTIGTDNVYKTAEAVKLNGGKIVLDPGPLPGINTKITACLDPDGWKTVFVDSIDFLKELE